MSYTLTVEKLALPALVVHGGAGAYLRTTTAEARRERGRTLVRIAHAAHARLVAEGARAAVLDAAYALEADLGFNAGYGSRLQQDGVARLSCALMDGARTRLSAVYNVEDCVHPSVLCAALQSRGDRNLDGRGARLLMRQLGMRLEDVRSPESRERWRALVAAREVADREGAIGSAGGAAAYAALEARLPIPTELEARLPSPTALDPRAATETALEARAAAETALPPESERYGTVGAVAATAAGEIWACTSTGGRGHEHVGRVSDSPTPAGNYACPLVAVSATGFGEQILDYNVGGRIATRMLDGMSLERALVRTFDELAAAEALLGVIAIASDGTAGFAYTTEACGVACVDADGRVLVDAHAGTP